MELIVLGVVAGLSFFSYALWKRARSEGLEEALQEERAQLALASAEPSLQALRPGDVITHDAVDYIVEGVLSLDDDGKVTRLYRIADAGHVRWLAVRPGADEPLVLDAVSGLLEGSEPQSAPDQLVLHGAPYRLAARAMARVGKTGSLGSLPAWDWAWLSEYAGAGARRILALAWGERTETFAGQPIAPHPARDPARLLTAGASGRPRRSLVCCRGSSASSQRRRGHRGGQSPRLVSNPAG